ncbi:hypothetical protein PVAND_008760 [Polypedilum vanderplanki]|uniref:Protein YIPF n=1 Tax=Polypedilum vanderplanki TaxID=319348 RepID=A0A9J6CAS8_POLVA|nr:hypothetical protein PVAND_008760 [Polypedilum vanderplanki]
MANYGNDQQNYWNMPPPQQQQSTTNQDFNFEMPDQFGQQLNFQTFDVNATTSPPNIDYAPSGYGNQAYLDPMASAYGQSDLGQQKSYTGNEFDDEPPLLEELGINPQHILKKTLSVLNPFRTPEREIFDDTDLAGPLVFCMAFGCFLLLSGKVTFSYIYGIGVLGCLAFYSLLTLMASATVTLGAVISVLGYCLLPMVILSGINVLITIQGMVGTTLTGLSILWCAISASKLFTTALSMDHQQVLIAYPCTLFYGVFALITIF